MRTLYCEPWVGEFGWELCWWNPLVRKHSQEYHKVIVASHANSEYLYEFADIFIPIEAVGTSYCDGNIISCPELPDPKDFDLAINPKKEFTKHRNEPERISHPRQWRNLIPDGYFDYQNFPYELDILCAFRPSKFVKGKKVIGKEYPEKKCQELVELLLKQGFSVGCYGGTDNYCPEGAVDLRGLSLEQQCAALALASCAVGPSSGTIHLASMCNCPHITWISSIHNTLKSRYKELWNPFQAHCEFICHNRTPEPIEVFNTILGMLERTKK